MGHVRAARDGQWPGDVRDLLEGGEPAGQIVQATRQADRPVRERDPEQIVDTIVSAVKKSGYDGFLSLEPHLKAAGQFSGFSGPALFKMAVDALKGLCKKNGIQLAGT